MAHQINFIMTNQKDFLNINSSKYRQTIRIFSKNCQGNYAPLDQLDCRAKCVCKAIARQWKNLECPSSYWPIIHLPVLGKIYERILISIVKTCLGHLTLHYQFDFGKEASPWQFWLATAKVMQSKTSTLRLYFYT